MDALIFFVRRKELDTDTHARSAFQLEVRQGSCELRNAIRGMPGSEFEPRSPLQDVLMKDATQKTPHESAVFLHLYRLFSGEKVRKNAFFGKSVFLRERRHFRDAAEHSYGLV